MRHLSSLILAAGLIGLASGACRSASPDTTSTSGAELSMDDLPVKITAPVAGTFDQAIDHPATPSDPVPTFKQRYWYTKEFAEGPDSPTLLFICGESACSPSYMLGATDTAKVLHASIVVLEHRYYGESKPFSPATAEQMKYLTIRNALEDLASFEAYAQSSLGLGGKWIAIGGSYSGMLAAFYRLKHPELVVGAWASSAPVDVVQTFWGYDAVASRALGSECTLLFQQALTAVSASFDDAAELAALAPKLLGHPWPAGAGGKVDFETSVANRFEGEIQYGRAAAVCAALEQHRLLPLDGLVGYWAPPLMPDDAPADAGAPEADAGTPASDPVVALGPGGVPDLDLDPAAAPDFSRNSWTYQTCTEVGFFKTSNPNRTESVLPSGIDGSRDIVRCRNLFQRTPDIAKTRAEYYQPLLDGQASNVFFVNGTYDPWSSLGFTDPESPPPGGNTVFVVQHGSHCSELTVLTKTSPLPVFEAHFAFAKLAKQWLAAP